MALTGALQTYGDSSKREDVVLNSIEILTAVENQVQAALGKTKAINTVHSYLTDTLKIIRGVYKSFLIVLNAEMPTRANLI